MTRVLDFNDLKGRVLYNAIKGFPRWVKSQEQFRWFSPLDTIIFCLYDEESLKLPAKLDAIKEGQVAFALCTMGHSPKTIGNRDFYGTKWFRLEHLPPDMSGVLQNYSLPRPGTCRHPDWQRSPSRLIVQLTRATL
jgi:hypothetical protein